MRRIQPQEEVLGRCSSWCQCSGGRQLGLMLEELRGAGGAGRDGGHVNCGGWKKLDHAGPLCHSQMLQSFISTLKTIKVFKWHTDVSYDV